MKIRIRPSIVGIDILFDDAKVAQIKALRSILNGLIASNGIACDKELARYAGPKKETKHPAKSTTTSTSSSTETDATGEAEPEPEPEPDQ